MSKELIRLTDCVMSYDDDIVLDHLNLYINDKEFLTLLGPSGCGKTTTLRIIGGFLTPTSGDVFFDGVRINDVPPHKRAVNTVFQKYALFPQLNVFENVAFGLRLGSTETTQVNGKPVTRKVKLPEAEIRRRVMEMLEVVNLKGFEKRSISALSGGQQQRVAIARALVNRPKVLLLDEPLGALDMRLRKDMQNELKRIQQEMGITFIYVTHDQEEALAMSDTVVVMDGGRIQQIGTPEDIYNEPKNAFVADFIGESNIIDGIMRADGVVEIFNRKFQCLDKGFDKDEPVTRTSRWMWSSAPRTWTSWTRPAASSRAPSPRSPSRASTTTPSWTSTASSGSSRPPMSAPWTATSASRSTPTASTS